MRDEIIARAAFLLTELHLPPAEASTRLKDYFPDLELEERTRYVHEAHGLSGSDYVGSDPHAPAP